MRIEKNTSSPQIYSNKSQNIIPGKKAYVQIPVYDPVKNIYVFKYFSTENIRLGGSCLDYYMSNDYDSSLLAQIPLLKNKTFTPEIYHKLTNEEKDFLRKIINHPYQVLNPQIQWADENRTIKNDMKFFVKMSKKLKKILDKWNPEGWKMIGIGGSPSIFCEILKYLGEDTVNIPFSKSVLKDTLNYSKINFNKYFSEVGLNKEILNTGKQNIYTDFCASGHTMKIFKDLLKDTNLLKNEDKFVDFIKLFRNSLSYKQENLLNNHFLYDQEIKSYATCPRMKTADKYINYMDNSKNFKWSITAKLMHFAIIDHFENTLTKRLKRLVKNIF